LEKDYKHLAFFYILSPDLPVLSSYHYPNKSPITMSELRSLFVKLNIKKENLDRFLAAAPTTPVVDEDWTAWWDSRKMYSKSPLASIPKLSATTNSAVLASYVNAPESISTESRENDVYYFLSGFFSENYYEMLPMLALLKSVALYMGPGDSGEALVYDYFWGSKEVMAHLELSEGKAVLKHTMQTSKINKQLLAESDKMLQGLMDELSQKYGD
jgi:hypothetical protein